MQQTIKAADNGVGRQVRGPAPIAVRPRRYDAAELFDGNTEIEIVHQGSVYRLKITRQGKLILNK